MITIKQVFPTILEICPFYRKTWEKHLEHYGEELLYVAVPDMLNRCIDLYEDNEEQKIVLVFEAIEKLLVEGDEDVKKLIEIAILEELIHILGDHHKEFVKYLQPNSLRVWRTKSQRLINVPYPRVNYYL
jgi:hypothetical protein